MAEVPQAAFPRSRGAHRAALVVGRSPSLATRARISSSALALSEARRAWNRDRIGLVSDLRCECPSPTCQAWVPAVAESHRGDAGLFIVASTHFNGGLVVRAADRFFVVEPRALAAGQR